MQIATASSWFAKTIQRCLGVVGVGVGVGVGMNNRIFPAGIEKPLHVIESCKELLQLAAAERYVRLWLKTIPEADYFDSRDMLEARLEEKWAELNTAILNEMESLP